MFIYRTLNKIFNMYSVDELEDRLIDLSLPRISVMVTTLHCVVFRKVPWVSHICLLRRMVFWQVWKWQKGICKI